MFELNEGHTSFIIDRELYCYKAMLFGFKNVRATYQRLMNTIFKDLISKTMEVYMDDMLLKSKIVGDHITHLGEIFSVLMRYQIKLILGK